MAPAFRQRRTASRSRRSSSGLLRSARAASSNTRTSSRSGSACSSATDGRTAMVETIAHLLLKTGLDNYVATHEWVWPVCEILHFFGMAAIIGTVGLVDARMLGLGKGIPIASLERFVPIGVVGLLLNMITGFIFVAGNPVGGPQEYLTNLAFLIKMSLIAIAGVNLLVFYAFGIARAANATAPDGSAPVSAKVVAAVSLIAWFGVIFFGRFIMYNDTLLNAWGL